MRIPFKQKVMHLSTSKEDEDYLIGSKCQSCGATAFPKRVVCHKCMSDNVTEVQLSKRGKLESFTVAWAAPEGIDPPVIQGYVDLPEGVRVFARMTGCEPSKDALKFGQEMEIVFEELRVDADNNSIVTFMFKPATTGGIS